MIWILPIDIQHSANRSGTKLEIHKQNKVNVYDASCRYAADIIGYPLGDPRVKQQNTAACLSPNVNLTNSSIQFPASSTS